MAAEETLATASGAVAIVGIPAYIGWADRAFSAFLLYALIAGLALALADRFAVSHYRHDSGKILLQHATYRVLSVTFVGGLIYGLLILAI